MEDRSVNDDEFAELFKKLSSGQSTDASWRDVAAEFESLGKTFGEVLRRTWQTQGIDSGLGQLSDLLASAIQELNRTVDGTSEAAQARDQLMHVVESLQRAADRATAELRPELLNMLRRANTELRRQSGIDSERE
jgi:ABC-type transporter Mla subunit MlaD